MTPRILAEKLDFWPIARLKPYERNARTHSDDQVAQIAASIAEFSWTSPILVDESDGIHAGRGRLAAARLLGMSEVPVLRLDGLSEAQKRASVIATNRLALDASWNEALLALELGELKALAFDLELKGFAPGKLDA